MLVLPKRDHVTFRWLIDHIPITWWIAFIVAITSVFSAGVVIGKVSFKTLEGDISNKIDVRNNLQSEIQELTIQRAVLSAEIVTLEIRKNNGQKTAEQKRDELRKRVDN